MYLQDELAKSAYQEKPHSRILTVVIDFAILQMLLGNGLVGKHGTLPGSIPLTGSHVTMPFSGILGSSGALNITPPLFVGCAMQPKPLVIALRDC